MAKIPTGSTLSYGPVLPAQDKTADGSMFFLTAGYSDPANSTTNPTAAPIARTSGLHLFSFQQDANVAVVGDQVGQQWKQVSSLQSYVSTAGDTMTGDLVIQSGGTYKGLRLLNVVGNGGGTVSALVGVDAGIQLSSDAGPLVFMTNGVERLRIAPTGAITAAGATVWTSANDGAASTLDADLLDGQHGAYYLDSTNQTGIVPLIRGGTGVNATVAGGIVYGTAGQLQTSTAGTAGQLLQSGGATTPTWINASALQVASASQLTTARNITLTGNATGSASFNGTADASISVTVSDSAKLGGYSPSASATASTVMLRDGSGYTFHSYINSSTPNSENPTVSQFIVTNGADGFYRKASAASVQSALGLGNYVAKTGDAMTGDLNINGIALHYASSLIQTTGSISALGNLVSTGGVVQAGGGGFGYTSLQHGDASRTGYIDFTAANGNRQGYIGYSTGTGTGDGGTIAFVMAQANFSGEVVAYASDGRLKKNVTVIENAMDKIATLGGYSYDWDMEKTRRLGFHPANEHEHGLIAQEVALVVPDAVTAAGFNSDYLTVKYERLIALLVAGMNEQQAQINSLISEVEELKNQR